MLRLAGCVLCFILLKHASGYTYPNETQLDPATRQLEDFRLEHREPVGVLTTSAGKPVEVRESVTLNTNVFNNPYFFDLQSTVNQERIPERVVHTKAAGAFGYFEVTNDVSKYTKADVFNGIGKRTPVVARFSVQVQNLGGSDLVRETNALVVKFYTNEGNLDLLGLSFPVYLYRDPSQFSDVAHAFKRNPKTNLYDSNMRFDALTLNPQLLHNMLWIFSDFGIPNGYRKMDSFPIHAFELNNKHGDSYFVRFNFRTEQGVELLTTAAANALRALDADYSVRDLFNAIATRNYPAWKLEMDVIPKNDLKKLDYNPFDVTGLWKNGTYFTVPIGRLVLNRNPENFFKDVEQTAFNPGNLVPGIPGPPDKMFQARRFAYQDTQNYRLGVNHNKIDVNLPRNPTNLYTRDGVPPVRDNMRDAPNYYQNSYNGPVPYVDVARPKQAILLYDRNSVDLQQPANFYNTFVVTEGQRSRLALNIASALINTDGVVQKRTLELLYRTDADLGQRTAMAMDVARAQQQQQRPVLTLVETHPRTLDLVPPL